MSEGKNSAPSGKDYEKIKEYWDHVDHTIHGMLGGFTEVNISDADDSRGLLKRMLPNKNKNTDQEPRRVLDCGAGNQQQAKASHFPFPIMT